MSSTSASHRLEPCIFVPADGSDNFVYMVLPVRLRAGQ